jgi:hypothetical protein
MSDHDGFAESLMAKSDQINAADLVGGPITIKIAGLTVKNSEAQKWTMRLDGNEKFYRPCLGMRRLIAQIWGEPQNYAGRSMTIYRDPDVKYSAKEVGGIRISHMSHIDGQQKISVPISRAAQKEYLVRPLTVAAPAPIETPDAAYALARAAAANGKAAFTTWWQSDEGRACRQAVQPIMPELQAAVAAADAMPAQGDDECPM